MTDFRFAHPEWVHGIWLVLILTGIFLFNELRSNASLDRFMSRVLQSRLVAQAARTRKLALNLLLGIAGLFLVLALMRPQLGLTYVSTPQVGAEIMVALDVSRSMLADDVVPNRLERAKAEIRDLLPLLEGDQVGLIAFAGRASILCPLTPDFSFFRLVLDDVTANCVGRGGTRLEEPIRLASEAFGSEGESARVILLISDGEDHDSFPLEACDAAAELGIQVIAIGLGDEGGTPIRIVDPKSGAAEQLRDADGNLVRSRLDGETLREMALRTQGRYIPAGTRAIDLEEIYQVSIAPLMRDQMEGAGRTIRQEAYQWPALFALLCLFGMGLASGRARSTAIRTVLLFISLTMTLDTMAVQIPTSADDQDSAPGIEGEVESEVTPPKSTESDSDDPPQESTEPLIDPDQGKTPREVHNDALEDFEKGNFTAARDRFERADSLAGADVELRYRCRYHLGWVAVREAENLIEAEPEKARESLEVAANRFRDAIRIRPRAEEARHNLEIVLRRIRELSDALREQEELDLAARLDALIESQRALLSEARSLIERDVSDPSTALEEPRRREYRAVAATEREILSELESFARDADEERRSIEALAEEQRSPEQLLQRVRLIRMLEHLTRAQERIGQARRTLRRQQGERASRRASLGLSALKRAREQLKDPLQILDGLLPDVQALAGQGLTLIQSELPRIGTEAEITAPPWLTNLSLQEDSNEVAGRVSELADQFRGAVEAERPAADPEDQEALEQEKLLELARQALPHLDAAKSSFEGAATSYESAELSPAFEQVGGGLAELLAARELFLDTKGLIELLWSDENQVLAYLRGNDEVTDLAIQERVPALGEFHRKNVTRISRLRSFIEEEAQELELAKAAETDPNQDPNRSSGPPAPSAEELAQLEQRMQIVLQLLDEVERTTAATDQWFQEQSSLEPSAIQLTTGVSRVEAVLPPLEELRRFYFTIVEHLKDLARRQLELNDETADAVALAQGVDQEPDRHLGPLQPVQAQLRSMAEQIAPALKQQAEQMSQQPGAEQTGQGEEVQQAWIRASELVESAAAEQQTALDSLFGEPYEFARGTAAQQAALERLAEAIYLLEPPQEDQQEDGDQDSEQGEQNQEDSQEQSADPAQLLQAVRDREAKRRAEQQRDGAADPTVEKDW